MKAYQIKLNLIYKFLKVGTGNNTHTFFSCIQIDE